VIYPLLLFGWKLSIRHSFFEPFKVTPQEGVGGGYWNRHNGGGHWFLNRHVFEATFEA
jgi:hypothetical protein